MRYKWSLQVTFDRAPGNPELGDLLRQWFTSAFDRLGGPLVEVLRRQLAAPGARPYDQRGDMSAGVGWSRGERQGDRHTAREFTEATWAKFLKALDNPWSYQLYSMHPVGDPSAGDWWPQFAIEARRNPKAPQWWYLSTQFSREWLDLPGYEEALVGVLRDFTEVCNPTHGELSRDNQMNLSELENLLRFRRDANETTQESRQILRGYGWITVCAQELGDRLGGVEGLRATGAFTEVAALGRGGYWLQATARRPDYDEAAAERVFRALAPVLPPGEPFPSQWKSLLVMRDASLEQRMSGRN